MQRKNILVIDDNITNLELMKTVLEIENFHIQTAVDAIEAKKILETFLPDLILMDLQLPGMSGLEFTKLLRTNPKFDNVIIIAVTAYAMVGDKEAAIASGCNGYISKPIDVTTFSKEITAYLSVESLQESQNTSLQ